MVTCGQAAVGGGNNFKLLAALVNPGSQSNEVLEGSFSTACSISSRSLMFRYPPRILRHFRGQRYRF